MIELLPQFVARVLVLPGEGHMHTATVLREEIFAVEVVVPAATTVATFGVVIRVAEAFGAAVEAQLEVL